MFAGTTGIVDYSNYDDMKYAIRKLDDSEFRNAFSRAYIRVKEHDHKRSLSRSPSRSRSHSRSRSRDRRSLVDLVVMNLNLTAVSFDLIEVNMQQISQIQVSAPFVVQISLEIHFFSLSFWFQRTVFVRMESLL
ncbi:uncharacterized protein A4U43_UnF630 [Asparagus officinalis]|uniref:RRM domain-containing protein n=1 Tax=Asparagus officinalis TaxID=4686 RepID=A0A1R3L7R0_ASPOF|nr:uncharacterized protein A4U43_UnF630 [Asparagus officinalis]